MRSVWALAVDRRFDDRLMMGSGIWAVDVLSEP
jgi:hypothetical protein